MAIRDWSIMIKERPGHDPALQAVRMGFSWGALIFRELWALYRGAWYTAGLIIVLMPLVTLLAQITGFDTLSVLIVQLAMVLGIAFAANELRLAELSLRRYRLFTVLKARDLDEAEALGLILWSREPRATAPAPAAPAQEVAASGEQPRPLWTP